MLDALLDVGWIHFGKFAFGNQRNLEQRLFVLKPKIRAIHRVEGKRKIKEEDKAMSFIDEWSKVSGVVPQGSVFAQPDHGRTRSKNGQIKKTCSRQRKKTLQRLGTATIICLG
jgi:hypothetical protein